MWKHTVEYICSILHCFVVWLDNILISTLSSSLLPKIKVNCFSGEEPPEKNYGLWDHWGKVGTYYPVITISISQTSRRFVIPPVLRRQRQNFLNKRGFHWPVIGFYWNKQKQSLKINPLIKTHKNSIRTSWVFP